MPKIFVGGSIQCFRNTSEWKNFPQKKEISLLSVGKFFSHSAENFREGNHSMCQKNCGMEKLYAEGGDITILLLELFFLTVAKYFVVGIIQCFRKNRAWEIFMQKKEISLFSVGTFFFSQC